MKIPFWIVCSAYFVRGKFHGKKVTSLRLILILGPGDAWHHDGAREIEGTSTSTAPWLWLMMDGYLWFPFFGSFCRWGMKLCRNSNEGMCFFCGVPSNFSPCAMFRPQLGRHTKNLAEPGWLTLCRWIYYVYVYFDVISSSLACSFPLPNQHLSLYLTIYICCMYLYVALLYVYMIYIYVYIPRTQMMSIFEGQHPKTRPFPTKTRVIWVLGIHIMEYRTVPPTFFLCDWATCPRTELVLRRWLSDFGLGCVGSVIGDMPDCRYQLVGMVFEDGKHFGNGDIPDVFFPPKIHIHTIYGMVPKIPGSTPMRQ